MLEIIAAGGGRQKKAISQYFAPKKTKFWEFQLLLLAVASHLECECKHLLIPSFFPIARIFRKWTY